MGVGIPPAGLLTSVLLHFYLNRSNIHPPFSAFALCALYSRSLCGYFSEQSGSCFFRGTLLKERPSRCTSMVSSFASMTPSDGKYHTVLDLRKATDRHLLSSCEMQSTFGSNNDWRSGNSTIWDILSSAFYQATSQNNLIWMRKSKDWEPLPGMTLPKNRIYISLKPSPRKLDFPAFPPRILPWTASPPITHKGSRLRNLPYVSWKHPRNEW